MTAARFNAATVTAAYNDDAVAEMAACDSAATVKAAARFSAAALKDTVRTAAPSTLHCWIGARTLKCWFGTRTLRRWIQARALRRWIGAVTAVYLNAATVTAPYFGATKVEAACFNTATVAAVCLNTATVTEAAQFDAAAVKDTMRTAAPCTAQMLHWLRIPAVIIGYYRIWSDPMSQPQCLQPSALQWPTTFLWLLRWRA